MSGTGISMENRVRKDGYLQRSSAHPAIPCWFILSNLCPSGQDSILFNEGHVPQTCSHWHQGKRFLPACPASSFTCIRTVRSSLRNRVVFPEAEPVLASRV